jgi:predicted metal-dependent hydrolase
MANNVYQVDIDGVKIPIKYIVENRGSVRVALAKEHVILRMPKYALKSDVDNKIQWAINWLRDIKNTKPQLLSKYIERRQYKDGQSWTIAGKTYTLLIRDVISDNGRISLKGDELHISLPQANNYDKQKLISKLLIRFAQKGCRNYIISRVGHYNNLYFKKEINDVRLKHNSSNWGSCSTGKNLNFSIRLLLAPEWVIDYVVIHELAHLIEMNHSDRFWNIVERIMPNYQDAEKHLKKFSSHYEF